MCSTTVAGRHRRKWAAAGQARGRLFLFHGTHEHSGRYAPFAAEAAARGIEVVSVDWRGHGKSEGAGTADLVSASGTIDDAIALVDSHASPLLPYVLFGHSLGSMVALLAARRLSTRAEGAAGAPAGVMLSGFAMDSEGAPLGVESLKPMIRAAPSITYRLVSVLAAMQPGGAATPLDAMKCTSDASERRKMAADPLHYQGWIRNRTALVLLDLRAACREALPSCDFPILMARLSVMALFLAPSPELPTPLAPLRRRTAATTSCAR